MPVNNNILLKDQLENQISSLEEKEAIAKEYRKKASECLGQNRPNEAILIANDVVAIYKTLGNNEGIAETMNFLGIAYASLAQDSSSVDCFLEGLSISLEYNYVHLIVKFYNNIATKYIELHEYEKALELLRKAEAELKKPAFLKSENYIIVSMLTYLNLCISSIGNDEIDKAERYLKRAKSFSKKEGNNAFAFSMMVTECRLRWKYKDEEFIKKNAYSLLNGAFHDIEVSDYISEFRDICTIFKEVNLIGHWEKIIKGFEEFTNSNNSAYLRLMCLEFWLDYYRHIGDENAYKEYCKQYVELSSIRSSEIEREKCDAIEMRIKLQQKEIERRKAEEKSNTDRLTGLGNRYMLEKDASISVQKCRDENGTLAVGIIDIDCFKEVNDTYGHIHGDDYLEKISKVLSVISTGRGKVYRYGGDEFVYLMENADESGILKFASTVKKAIYDIHLENKNSHVTSEVTLSQGYRLVSKFKKSYTLESLLAVADKALYKIKENGRNGYAVETDDGIIME